MISQCHSKLICYFIGLLLVSTSIVQAQEIRTVSSSVPFLLLNNNAKSTGYGGVNALSPYATKNLDLFSNPSLIAGNHRGIHFDLTYAPWSQITVRNSQLIAKDLIKEIYNVDSKFQYHLNENNSVEAGFRYFSLGDIIIQDQVGNYIREHRSSEYAFQLKYARKVNNFRIGISSKVIKSDLIGEIKLAGESYHPGISFGIDLGFDYHNQFNFKNESIKTVVLLASSIQNMGPKIKYSGNPIDHGYLPAIWKVAVGNSLLIEGEQHGFQAQINILYQIEKMLVPSPTSTDNDANGIPDHRELPWLNSVFKSFADAEGGASEELREFYHRLGGGIDVTINDKVKIGTNAGAYFVHETKGNIKDVFLSAGIAFMGVDITTSFLFIEGNEGPIRNLYQLSVGYSKEFDGKRKERSTRGSILGD